MPDKTVNNTETEIVIVLDRSGSMSSIIEGTLQGFNTFLKEQKNAAGEAFMTLVQFDDRYQIDYHGINAKHVADLNKDTYVPRGMTALHDAIGKTINELKTERPVIFVIITDGLENASREFNGTSVKALIEAKTKLGWKFVFMGANQDAVATGEKLGMDRKMSMTYTADNAHASTAFRNVASNTARYRGAMADGLVGLQAEEKLHFSAQQREESHEE
jgi:uncharacterized protein YegL